MTSRMHARITVGLVVLGLLVTLAPPPASAQPEASAGRRRAAVVGGTTRPGPVQPGYEGPAYAVPAQNEPGSPPNAVRVTLKNADGQVVGTASVPAGSPRNVRALPRPSDQVAIPWTEGRTAFGPRASFWVMPSFIGLGDMKVDINGKPVAIGASGVAYDRGKALRFNDPNPDYDGTVQLNRDFLACKRDTWGMGQQSFAVDLIEYGIHRNERARIDEGIKGMDWGVAVPINDKAIHQLHRDCDDTTVADFGYTHHTTQWLVSLGRAAYLLAASPYAGEYRDKIDSYIDRQQKVARQLTRPANWKYWNDKVKDGYGNDFTHRTFMMAAALGLASTLADNRADSARYARLAAKVGRHGIDNQFANGINPERGGFDVGYQMFGTWLAQVYFSSLGPETKLKSDLDRTISRAVKWMSGRVNPTTGQINIRGSSRTCAETLWATGATAPQLEVYETIRGFLYWGLLKSEPGLVNRAVLVDRGRRAGNPCPGGNYKPPVEQQAAD